MYPIIFEFNNLKFYTFGVFIALAFISAFLYTSYFLKKSKEKSISQNSLEFLFICIVIISIIGSKLFYIIINFKFFSLKTYNISNLLNSGLIYYGGVISSIIFLLIYTRKNKTEILSIGDLFTPSLALGYSIGRIGCFFAGCCYGIPSKLPWAIYSTYTRTYVHPTQLYESIISFIVFIFLHINRNNKHKKGFITGIYLLFYSISRFSIDFFRSNDTYILTLSQSQIISIFFFILGSYILCKN
ncbi:MAG: prolipoprotein diacylglyceryl transferase [Endomicrobium sp.]|jgi:phosphatidylglycerol:prolipoprotein diacylglycerol transferase|nr:prolipoprotein diacylglyceryl transferase [Endomicrobium sp.]